MTAPAPGTTAPDHDTAGSLRPPPGPHARATRAGRPRPAALLREGVLTARAQPVATLTATLVVAMVCFVVLVTTGRAAAAERAVIASIDSVGTRLVTTTDNTGSAGIDPSAVDDVAGLAGVTWALGLGPAEDVANADRPSAIGTPMRAYVGPLPDEVTVTAGRLPRAPGEAVVSASAAAALGLLDGVGAVTSSGARVAVVGQVALNGPLATFDGSVLRLAGPDSDLPLRYLYVVVDHADQAPDIARAIEAVLPVAEPSAVEIETSTGVLALRDVVAGTLGASARQLMAGVLGVGLVLTTVTMLGAVAGRRRELGRRRALGASRSAVVVLVLAQSAVAGVAGVLIGVAAGLAVARFMLDAMPSAGFVLGVAALALLVTLAGSAPPALAAALRDPVRILRVP